MMIFHLSWGAADAAIYPYPAVFLLLALDDQLGQISKETVLNAVTR
jgi:hypothetical protein